MEQFWLLYDFMISFKGIIFILFSTIIATCSWAQTTFTANSGNWNVAGNWSNGIPDANTDAIIQNGRNCTVNIANAVCKSLTISGGNSSSGLTISLGNSLAVTNATTIEAPSSGNKLKSVVVAGTFSTGSFVMNSTSNNNRDCALEIAGGTATVSGNISMAGTAERNAINFTAGGTLKVAGTISGGTIAAGSGAVEFNNMGTQSIPAYTYNDVVISGAGIKSCSGSISFVNVTITSGELSIGSNTLSISGTISGAGSITGSANSNLTITSNTSLSMTQTNSAARTLNNLTYNSTDNTLSLSNPLELTGTLTVAAGTLVSEGNLTLISTASGDARVAQSAGSITGNVTVQKYLPAGSSRRWLHMGSPISNFTWNQLIDDILISGPGGGGFDVNGSGFPSAYYYTESVAGDCGPNGWNFPANVSNSVPNNRGIKFYFRGDRDHRRLVWNNVLGMVAVTLDFTGTLNQGTQAMGITYTNNGNSSWDGWNFVPNPYPSAIDWNAASGWTKTNVSGTIYVWNAQSGTYATWNGASGTNGMTNGRISMGQGFWVKATTTSPTLTMTEAVKVGTATSGFFKSNSGNPNTFRITMVQDSVVWDDAVFNFDNSFDRSYQKETGDALKLVNSSINLWSVSSDNENLVINNYPSPQQTDTVVLGMTSSNGGIFTLKFSTDSVPGNILIFLIDEYRNRVIDVRKEKEWKVLINTDSQSYALGRLKVVFVNVNLPQITFNPAGDEVTKQTKVYWTSSKEIYTRKYEVQYSTDSINFITIQTVQLNDTLLLQGCSYFFVHNNPLTDGANYYRLAKYDMYGEVELTDIKKVVFNSVNTGIATDMFFNYVLYPVPAQSEMYFASTKENISNVSTFEIMNVNGQKISNIKYHKQDNVIVFDVNDMPEALYILNITTTDGKKSSIKFQKR